MNNLLQQLTETLLPKKKSNSCIVLLDRIDSASELAFMLDGEWDLCNAVTLTKYDKVALSEAAALIGAKWCLESESVAFLPKIAEKTLCDRYKTGERYFINANLRCSRLDRQCLKGINLNYAFLELANLTEADLSEADLSAANLSNANLTKANLTRTNLFRANLTGANLSDANLKSAKLQKACLKGANLNGANLDGADLSLADLRGANLDNVSFNGANTSGTKLTVEQLPSNFS